VNQYYVSDETIHEAAAQLATAVGECVSQPSKIQIIKDLRDRYGEFGGAIGLKEAKDRIEQLMQFSYATRVGWLEEEFRALEEAQRPPDIRTPRVVTHSGAELRDFNGSMIAQCSVTGPNLVISSGDGLTSITFHTADLDGIIEMLQSALPPRHFATAETGQP